MPTPESPLDAVRLARAAALAAGDGPPDGSVAALLPLVAALVDAPRAAVMVRDDGHERVHTALGTSSPGDALLRVPIVAASHDVGILEVARPAAAPFSEGDRWLLALLPTAWRGRPIPPGPTALSLSPALMKWMSWQSATSELARAPKLGSRSTRPTLR